jgi:hypothetical protein
MIKTKALRSRKALMVQGALVAYLAPRLAADAKVDLGMALDGVNRKNYAASRAKIAERISKATTGKLAADADIGDLVELLDSMKDANAGSPEEDELMMDGEGDPLNTNPPAPLDGEPGKPPEGEDDDANEAQEAAAVLGAIKGKVDDMTYAAVAKALGQEAQAVDEPPPTEGAPNPERGSPPGQQGEDCDMPTKAAMDAAIAKATRETESRTIARLRAAEEARELVRPHVGKVDVAMDSAESIYKLALDAAGIELDGVPPAAYKAMVGLLRKPEPDARPSVRLGQDAAAAEGFAKRFPEAGRLM